LGETASSPCLVLRVLVQDIPISFGSKEITLSILPKQANFPLNWAEIYRKAGENGSTEQHFTGNNTSDAAW
jgi:hypothetical protein